MSFWRRKKKAQHPPAASLLGDDPASDKERSTLLPAAPTKTPGSGDPNVIAGTLRSDRHRPNQVIGSSGSGSLERSSPPAVATQHKTDPSSNSTRRFSRFTIFRRSSSKGHMDAPNSSGMSPTISPISPTPNNATITKTLDNTDPQTQSPQPRSRIRTPSQSPYASPRTSIYGALSSPSNSSNPGEIFERSIESVPSVSTQCPSVKGFPTHQVLEDIIPPALEATAATFTDHVNPENVEIVTFSEIQSNDSRSNAGSPIPPSPILASPLQPPEATPNPWETETLTSSSPDLDIKRRTLNLMSAVDHLADEIIHPALPASVDKKLLPSPLSLSPAIPPADGLGNVRHTLPEISMERSPSQSSSIGDVVVIKQTMGEAMRLRIHGPSGEASLSVHSPSIESQRARKEEIDANPWTA